ncbi:hypothetical protein Dthio_PD3643 [Desulfonatronospira thiodismutans ASO3-1]|uniref:Uncharacterized protein n=1 Tax=Desulfonatronospira thiodismutans ASO3-1 TaxID=555779 RepID=D6SJY4_9BACT|nr:hypothetical protein Dthio_PD3643 [Desulfonatronospira thiodismutans ASO3-1]
MSSIIKDAPGLIPRGIKKNVQQAGLTYFLSYIPARLHCQAHIQEIQDVAKISAEHQDIKSLQSTLLSARYPELK